MTEHTILPRERLQLLRLLAALIIFICALHVLCSQDNQMALARIQRRRVQPASVVVPPVMRPVAGTGSSHSAELTSYEFSH